MVKVWPLTGSTPLNLVVFSRLCSASALASSLCHWLLSTLEFEGFFLYKNSKLKAISLIAVKTKNSAKIDFLYGSCVKSEQKVLGVIK
jgi:hypothetical protein